MVKKQKMKPPELVDHRAILWQDGRWSESIGITVEENPQHFRQERLKNTTGPLVRINWRRGNTGNEQSMTLSPMSVGELRQFGELCIQVADQMEADDAQQ